MSKGSRRWQEWHTLAARCAGAHGSCAWRQLLGGAGPLDAYAQGIGAQAFTRGTDNFFPAWRLDPGSPQGFAQVKQQAEARAPVVAQIADAPANDAPALERKANKLDEKAARGDAAHGDAATSGGARPQAAGAPAVAVPAAPTPQASEKLSPEPAKSSRASASRVTEIRL